MHLFIFDYEGTLTTLKDPVTFIQALRQKHPDAQVVLHTGASPSTVAQRHPGLRGVLDAYWEKPHSLTKLDKATYDRVTIVDDEEAIRRALARALRDRPQETWRVLDERGLPGLLTE